MFVTFVTSRHPTYSISVLLSPNSAAYVYDVSLETYGRLSVYSYVNHKNDLITSAHHEYLLGSVFYRCRRRILQTFLVNYCRLKFLADTILVVFLTVNFAYNVNKRCTPSELLLRFSKRTSQNGKRTQISTCTRRPHENGRSIVSRKYKHRSEHVRVKFKHVILLSTCTRDVIV